MKVDVTTKLLLGLIALALWGLLLKPIATPIVGHAQGRASDGAALVIGGDRITGVFVAHDGVVYRFKENLGQPEAIGRYGPGAIREK